MFLEENNYFEEAFKAYERGVALFKWPHVYDIWNTYLTKFINRYVRTRLFILYLMDWQIYLAFSIQVNS